MLELIGGLPEKRGPMPVRQFGSIDGDGFRVERIAYQSLPGLYVTADVYVPVLRPRAVSGCDPYARP